ncbi:hypothetical protein QAD02_018406 [Eretmocerus hayati]|uniref:Uncharacterized protein n=1 Tax=Eretmocerus hayati TaxID=131215 RepID=A0ACC2PGA5_9HYME|nr:hypothetical protein QAD02_018406 [Eretmocerus hayati]
MPTAQRPCTGAPSHWGIEVRHHLPCRPAPAARPGELALPKNTSLNTLSRKGGESAYVTLTLYAATADTKAAESTAYVLTPANDDSRVPVIQHAATMQHRTAQP